MRRPFFSIFLIFISFETFSQEIESSEKENYFNFLAVSSLDYKDPECDLIEKDFEKINPSFLYENKEDYDLTKLIISKICSKNLNAQIEFDREITKKISFEDDLDYMNYFLYLRDAISPYLKKNDLNKIEEISNQALDKTYKFGRKNNFDILVIRPLASIADQLCKESFYKYCLRFASNLESRILDVFKISEVILKRDNPLAAAFMLKQFRFYKLEALGKLGREYNSSLLSELINLNNVYFYDDSENLIYRELFLEYEKYLEENFPKESVSMLNKVEKNLVMDLNKEESFFFADDFFNLAAAYLELQQAGSFPKEEFEKFKKYSFFYVDKFSDKEDQADIFSLIVALELMVYGRDSAINGEVCNFARERNLLYILEFDFNFICDQKNKNNYERYKDYLAKINTDNIDFEEFWLFFLGAPFELIDQMAELKDSDVFEGETTIDAILFLMKQIFLYLPNKYKSQKLANDWFSFIKDSLNVVKDGTEVSLKDGSAMFLSTAYQFINPTFNHGRLSHFLSPLKQQELNAIIERKFILNPDRLSLEIDNASREDLRRYKNSLLSLIKNYYYHVNALGLIREKENAFDEINSSLRSMYGYGVKVWCENSFEYGCAEKKQREGLIFLSRDGSKLLLKLHEKIQAFNNEENKIFKEFSVPELFNKNVYSREYKDIRHWILFLKDLYFDQSLHKEYDYFSDSISEEELASLFIKNMSLENYSRIQNAFQKNKVLKKYKGTEFEKKIISYDDSLNKYLRLKESLINFQPSAQGGKSVDGAQAKLLEISDQTRMKYNEVYFHKDENNKPVFNSEEFSPKNIGLDTIQKLLDEDEVMMIFSYIADGPSISLYLSNERSYMTFKEKKDVMSENVTELIQSINVLNPSEKFDNWHVKTFSSLGGLGVVESKNNKRKKVYVISDDSDIQKIPFSAIYDDLREQWAFEKYDFVYLDSLGSFVLSKEQEKIKLTKNLSFAAFANPDFKGSEKDTDFKNLFSKSRGSDNKELLENLSKLPETEEEVLEISKNFIKSKIFVGQNATEDNLKKFLGNASNNAQILSFATHAFSDTTNYTREHGLAFSPPLSSDSLNDGFLTSQEIRKLNLNDSIIILSACDTDKPLMITQDSYSGFIRSFIEAGAKTILYTSWDIDSKSAQVFMTETFKAGVASNLQISEAVSSTMKKFERGDFGEKYRHPFYWAPYKVFGID
jgi:CHAT domain-containing protein